MRSILFLLYGCLCPFLAAAKPSLTRTVRLTLPAPPLTLGHQMARNVARRSINANEPGYYGPSQTALLFLDYLNILFDMITDNDVKQNVVESAKQLLEMARKNKVAIIHCIVDVNLNPPPTSKIYDQWFTINKPIFDANPELAEEYPELAPTGNSTGGYETVSLRVAGPRSAFINEGLLPLLRNKLGVTSLILGGIATSGAVLGTALQGIDENFVITVVEDAVWDPDQQLNDDILSLILPSSAYVASTEEALCYLRGC